MAQDTFDRETYLLYPLFALGTAASLGLVEPTVLPILDLSEVIVSTNGIEWTLGRLLSAAALIAVLVNRSGSITDTEGIDLWVAYATLGLVIAPPFAPALAETLASQPANIIAFLTQSVGFAIVTYVN